MQDDLNRFQPLFEDVAFYERRSKGRWKIICPPVLSEDVAIADSHTHVQALRNPALSLARCALLGVETVCDICDITQDGPDIYNKLDAYQRKANNIAHRIVQSLERGDAVAGAHRGCARDLFGHTVALMRSDEGCADQLEQLRARVIARAQRFIDAGKPIVPHMAYAIGCHPQMAHLYTKNIDRAMRAILSDARTHMVGEIGLDFSYPTPDPDTQIDVFRRQIRYAQEFDMPISLHIRDAHDQALRVLSEEHFDMHRAVLHCCNLNTDELKPWVASGCNIGYGGILTFGKSDDVRAGAKTVPDSQLLVETDCPYMCPTPLRGNENAPEYALFTAARLADVKGATTPDQISDCMRMLSTNEDRVLQGGR